MKKLTLILSISTLLLFSNCSSNQETDTSTTIEDSGSTTETKEKATKASSTNENSSTETVSNSEAILFLNDSKSLLSVKGTNPILEFKKTADATATRSRSFNKKNIQALLDDAKTFSHCAIIVEDHTIIKINDYYDCKQSSSWGACMPICEGYIKKGELQFQKDYLNNIIGLPDKQKRTIYYFQ